MRAGKGGGYYCSSKAAAGEDANEKGYCNHRLDAAPAAAPADDAHADIRRELSAALVAAGITPVDLTAYFQAEGVVVEGVTPTVAQIIGYAQEAGLTLAQLAERVAVDTTPFE